jgi:zinc transport system ATP-binding protein
MSLIEARGLSMRFGGQEVFHDVDFTLERGEIVTIVGPNGSGKTSLLRVLVGPLKPTGGTVKRAKNLKIGYVPQKLTLDPTLPLTVRRFLNLPRRNKAAEVHEALMRTGVADLGDRQMSQLSGGQAQRVMLSRATLGRPDVLMLDEPTQGLDQPGSAAFYTLIEELRRDIGCAVVMISHELHVVMSASDRVICLNGHICCQGAPEIVRSAPEYRALFGTGTHGALAIYRHEHDHETCDHDPVEEHESEDHRHVG